MEATTRRWVGAGLWLLPVHGLLTLVATFTPQPDPLGDFAAWSRFVTTPAFYWSHLIGSMLGQALGLLGVCALAARLAGGRRGSAAPAALAMAVIGSSVIFGLFGVAAFVQPAIGAAYLEGGPIAARVAPAWYEAVFGPSTLGPALVGLTVFSFASVVMAFALGAADRVPRWAVVGYGASGPCIGILGLVVHPLQTVGSVLLLVTGIVIARRLAGASSAVVSVAPAAPLR